MKRVLLLIPLLIFFVACDNDSDIEKKSNKKQKNEKRKDIKFTANSEKIAEVGEIFQIVFEVNENPSSFNPPNFENFDVLSGPSTSSFSSTQIINGKSTQEIKTSYTYNISASEPGEFTINEAEVIIDGNSYKSNFLKIKIIGEDNTENNSINLTNNKNKKDIFLSAEFSKTTVYNGEFIIAVYKIFTKKDFHNITELEFPDFRGFKIEILEAPRQLSFHNEIINGEKYNVALLKKVFLFAQKPGNYTISPYNIDLKIRKKDGKTRDFFGNLVDNYKIINKKLTTGNTKITVKQIPEPVPNNFSGITGNDLTISSVLEKNKLKTNDGTNFNITISGFGNIYLLNEINIKLPDGLSFFKPEIEKSEKYTDKGMYGERTFKYVIAGEKDGTYLIDSIIFTYFNPKVKKYETIFAPKHKIIVGKGISSNEISTDIKNVNTKDIRYISNNVNLKKHGKSFIGTTMYYISFFILILILVTVILVQKKIKDVNSDTTALKMRKAKNISEKKLKLALKYMKANDNNAFYKEILNVVWGYLSDKLSVSADALTKDSTEEILKLKNIDLKLITKLQSVIDICGYAQYGPVGEKGKLDIVYKKTGELINDLENYL